MERVDAVVVGAGVVGLACARALAGTGLDVVVLEAADAIGTQTSSRNSEVIHAGLYYPPGSLKARLCVKGREQLYRYCAERGVAHSHCGKLVVATDAAQEPDLSVIASRGLANGVDDLRPLTRAEALALEPALACTAALLSPSTGIVDSHGLMRALLADAVAEGAVLALRTPLVRARVTSAGFAVDAGGAEPVRLECRLLVNCAGLGAAEVARRVDGLPADRVPTVLLARGNYFVLCRRPPFTHLVYPVPEPGGLGVHLTLDLGGQARFGPDVEWVDAVDYAVDPARGARFYDRIRRYWPGLPDGALSPGYAGIRPKLSGPGAPARDFAIEGPTTHGVPGLVNLFGIESPGLTACLAIADEALSLLEP